MAELADALDLGSSGISHGGSSPPFRIVRVEVRQVSQQSYVKYKRIEFESKRS